MEGAQDSGLLLLVTQGSILSRCLCSIKPKTTLFSHTCSLPPTTTEPVVPPHNLLFLEVQLVIVNIRGIKLLLYKAWLILLLYQVKQEVGSDLVEYQRVVRIWVLIIGMGQVWVWY